jgi:hypothetical protein
MQKQKILGIHQKRIVVMMKQAMRIHQAKKMKWQAMPTLDKHKVCQHMKICLGEMEIQLPKEKILLLHTLYRLN